MLFKFSIFTIGLLLLSPLTAFAQPQLLTDCGPLGLECPTTGFIGEKLVKRIMQITSFLIFFSGIFVTIALIYGAFKYITSTGDEAEAKKAKQIIIYALIGFLVIGISGIAVNFFRNVLSS